MIELIKEDLARLGVHHDLFASEAAVQQSGAVDRALAVLDAQGPGLSRARSQPPKGKTPSRIGSRSSCPCSARPQFGDDQDRPIRKSDGSWTYFAADAAYHMQKLETADELINVWGADHTGTVKRTQAAVEALAGRPALDVKLVQMVRLLRGGELVKMSKRSGSFVTLAEVVEEVGKDVVRFTMLTRKSDAQMDFDFAKVVEASKDNPVFYVKYAHARISSLRRARRRRPGSMLPATPTVACSTRRSWRWSSSPPIPAHGRGARRRRTSRTASPSISATSPPRSTPCGTRVMKIPRSVSCWHKIPNLTRARMALADAIGQIVRNGLGDHGRDRGRGDAAMSDERPDGDDNAPTTMTSSGPTRTGCPGSKRSRKTMTARAAPRSPSSSPRS